MGIGNIEYTYYGRIDHSVKPRTTLADQMLTEHIQRLVEKEVVNFKKDLEQLRMSTKIELKSDIDKINKNIKEICTSLNIQLNNNKKKRKRKINLLEL